MEIYPKKPNPGVHLFSDTDNVVFLTVKTYCRNPWLANPIAHRHLRAVWLEATAWLVGTYLLMPDHLHLFCAPRNHGSEIETWIKYWKRLFRLRHDQSDWRFQSLGWHHRLRGNESREDLWRYIVENPVRKGLAKHPRDWPFKGVIFEI